MLTSSVILYFWTIFTAFSTIFPTDFYTFTLDIVYHFNYNYSRFWSSILLELKRNDCHLFELLVSYTFLYPFSAVWTIFPAIICTFTLDIGYCINYYCNYSCYWSYNYPPDNHCLSRWILFTLRSPTIKNSALAAYVKPLYIPKPYQAIIAVESCNINQVLSWHVNVSAKSVKIEVERSPEMLPKLYIILYHRSS